ncbi:MAG: hypothetical protein JSS39_18740 [Nitrospira sp.]|nr:hypothetical protein [Nitrospira sp.]
MRLYFLIVVSVLGLCISTAHADSLESRSVTSTAITSWGSPVPLEQLDTQRGGTDTGPFTINANVLNAKLYNNAAIDNVTGHNTITGNAFAGASGLPTVFQNSGNNVIMQSGTVLNLTLK